MADEWDAACADWDAAEDEADDSMVSTALSDCTRDDLQR
jgi:hypothetical protein